LFAAESDLLVMSGFHISLASSVASLDPSMIVDAGTGGQGASIPIRGCTCTVSRNSSSSESRPGCGVRPLPAPPRVMKSS